MRSEYFSEIKKVIDEWDPIELLVIHCPNDEYDDISLELAHKITDNFTVEYVAREIYYLFVQAFGTPTFNKTLDECKVAALKIIASIKR